MSINAISTSMVPSFKAPIQFGAAAKPKAQEMVLDGGVSVQGNGFVEKYPDTMHANLSVQETARSREEVWEKMNKKAVATVNALKALPYGLKMSTNSHVNPILEWNDSRKKNEIKGYQGYFTISVTEELKSGTEVKGNEFAEHVSKITGIAEANEMDFGGASYSVNNRSQAILEALKLAAKDAVAQAQVVADAFGFKINPNRPFSVEVGHVGGVQPMPMMKASRSFGMAESAMADGGMSAESVQYEAQRIEAPPLTVRFMKEA